MGRRAKRRLAHAAVYALLIAAAVVMRFPIASMLTVSVRTNIEVMKIPPDWIPQVFTLDAYRKVLSSPRYLRTFVNTYFVALVVTFLSLAVGALAGYALGRFRFRGQRTVLMFLITTQMFPLVLLCIPYFQMVVRLGLYDTLTGVMMPFFASAFGTFLMRQAFEAIPTELEDAALIDGASLFQRIRHIYVPLSMPSFWAFAIISVTSHWNDFLWPLMVINSPDKRPLTVGLSVFTKTAEGTQDWGTIAAGTLMVIALLLITFLIFQKRFISSFVTSGIK